MPAIQRLTHVVAAATLALAALFSPLASPDALASGREGDAIRMDRLFVSSTGSDARACTAAAPCQTLARALQLAKPGAIVQLRAGTYPGQGLEGGKDGAPIVFEPAPGATVTFSGQLTVTSSKNLTIRGVHIANEVVSPGLLLQACNVNIRVEDVVAKSFAILEGNRNIVLRGGAYGGAHTQGVEEDPVVGTSHSRGPGANCDGAIAPPSRNLLFDGVLFHDSMWGATSRAFYDPAHPDCLQIQGYVQGLVIRNSTFLRCGDSFLGMYPDQGDIFDVRIENNAFIELGNLTYFGIQIAKSDTPYSCGNFVFRRNVYWPNNPTSWAPYSIPRFSCTANGSVTPVTENLIQAGFDRSVCTLVEGENGNRWTDNVFVSGTPCGTTVALPWGYKIVDGKLKLGTDERRALSTLFLLARGAKATLDGVTKELRARKLVAPARTGWNKRLVRRALLEKRYVGRFYGPPGWHQGVVTQVAWNRAQAALTR